jgi:hypothetical protein
MSVNIKHKGVIKCKYKENVFSLIQSQRDIIINILS